MTKRLVTIAGSDALAGGGIQADLATFTEYGYQGVSVLTSIVTVLGDDFNVYDVDSKIVSEQLESVFALGDIVGVKTGLIPNREQFELIASYLYKNVYDKMPIVVDPVMVVKENDDWDITDIIALFKEYLLPLATVITPNLSEAELLVGYKITTQAEMEQAVMDLTNMGPKSVVIKGGARLAGEIAIDMVFDGDRTTVFKNTKLDTMFNNGAGCTFASAITANLGLENSIVASVADAKDFVFTGIQNGIVLSDDDTLGNVWQSARRLAGGHYED